MPLYTFIMHFRDGVYISQVRADDPGRAKRTWAEAIDTKNVWGMGLATKRALIASIAKDTPTLIRGNTNVWCLYTAPRGYPCMIHFVETVG